MVEKKSTSSKNNSSKALHSKISSIKTNHLFLVSVVVLLLSIVLLATSLWIQHNTAYLAPVKGYPQNVKVSAGEVAVRVDSVSTTSGSGIFKAPSNQQYIIVGITIRNITQKPINVFPSTDIYLKDPNGNITSLSIYNLDHPYRAGELLPGDQVSGQLSYLVSKGIEQKLYVDGIWSGGILVFDVQPY
jgi:hypothetical protein